VLEWDEFVPFFFFSLQRSKRMSLSLSFRRLMMVTAALLVFSLLPWGSITPQAVQASAPIPDGWVPFGEGADVGVPGVTVKSAKASEIVLLASIPGAQVEKVNLDGQIYTRLGGEGFARLGEVGAPDLPVVIRQVEIPFGASYTLEVTRTRGRDTSLDALGLPGVLCPIQPAQPKCGEPPASVKPDAARYAAASPAAAVVLEETVLRGHRLLTIAFSPVSYRTADGSLRLSSQIEARIRLSGSNLALTEQMSQRYASPAFEHTLASSILNYNQGAGERTFGSKDAIYYLIITHPDYDTADLADFVAMKQSQGYTVSKVTTAVTGSTKDQIKAYIAAQYASATPPSYVLFVGDTDKIPNWNFVSSGQTSYLTDLYYVTMDGASDYVPDIYRGRFPVRNTTQLANMVNNAEWYNATSGAEDWVKKAAFLATDDSGNYHTAEGTHNYCINTYTQPRGYSGIFPTNPQPGGDKLYAITYNANTTHVLNSINDNRVMVVYSGHGSQTSWAGPSVTQTHVRNLTGVLSAYVVGHACVTADFNTAEAFSDTWVIQPNKGALVYVGASDNSYWDEDDRLQRTMFDTLYDDPATYVPSISEMLYAGLASVQQTYPSSGRYYWEEYNLFGDPSATIVLEPKYPDFRMALAPARVEMCGTDAETVSLTLSSVNEFADPVTLSLSGVPDGVTGTFAQNPLTPPASTNLNLESSAAAVAGEYSLMVSGVSGSLTHTADLSLGIFTAQPGAFSLSAPADGATNQPVRPTFTWTAATQGSTYRLQVATDAAFNQLVADVSGLTGTSYTLNSDLSGSTRYYWRMLASNACGDSAFTVARSFITLTQAGDCPFGATPQVLHNVDFEAGAAGWADASSGSYHWALATSDAHSPTHAFFAQDPTVTSEQRLVSPAIVLPASTEQPLSFSFWQKYAFEGSTSSCYDGGLLEISTNGGSTWTQVPVTQLLTTPYNGTIYSGYGNPLGGKPGWCADMDWARTVVNLNSYAGQTVQFRIRLGSDSSVGDTGWYVDDARIQSCSYGPMAMPDSYTMDEDTVLNVSAPGVLGNDNGSGLTAELVDDVTTGSLTLNSDGSFAYIPPTDYAGSVTFTYRAYDGVTYSSPATVTITVVDVPDAPLAVNDTYEMEQDMTLSVPAPGVLGNDSDPNGDAITAVLVDAPAQGSLTLASDGFFSYTPPAGYAGTVTFTYRATDGVHQSELATVTITINAIVVERYLFLPALLK
jgi:hypothetical protein